MINEGFIDGDATIENNFTHHVPGEGDAERYEAIRDQGKEFAYLLLDIAPASVERGNAIRKIEEAVFWANAAVARN